MFGGDCVAMVVTLTNCSCWLICDESLMAASSKIEVTKENEA